MRSAGALAPFSIRSFRFQWSADLCTAWALEMETLILGWYVLVESGSVVLLTSFAALMYVGTLLSPLVGVLGDRWGLRRLLASMRMAYALMAAVILVLAATHHLHPQAVLLVAFVVGLLKPSDIGMRTALVSTSVPAQQLVTAMGISRTTQDSARVGGALAGTGFMAAFGMVPAYVVIVLIYGLAVFLTTRAASSQGEQKPTHDDLDAAGAGTGSTTAQAGVPPNRSASAHSPPRRSRTAAAWRDLKDGLIHVWQIPPLRAAICLAAVVNLTAFPLTGGLMPYIARDVFALDERGLGWLVASFATGALVGSIGISSWGQHLRPARTMLLTCVIWHGFLAGFAAAPNLAWGMTLLLGAGLAQSISMVCLSILLLRCSDERFRARVMGVRMLAIYTLPLGLLAAGALIPVIGFRWMAATAIGLGLLLTAIITLTWRGDLLPRQALANTR